jgi:hypothetical protein
MWLGPCAAGVRQSEHLARVQHAISRLASMRVLGHPRGSRKEFLEKKIYRGFDEKPCIFSLLLRCMSSTGAEGALEGSWVVWLVPIVTQVWASGHVRACLCTAMERTLLPFDWT